MRGGISQQWRVLESIIAEDRRRSSRGEKSIIARGGCLALRAHPPLSWVEPADR
jgi:hypothetical protein